LTSLSWSSFLISKNIFSKQTSAWNINLFCVSQDKVVFWRKQQPQVCSKMKDSFSLSLSLSLCQIPKNRKLDHDL
jgi:hypothetical protein